MNRAMILDLLNQHRDEFLKRFGARRLALFGSAARDELRDDSDIDVLVEFDGPATFDRYVDLKDYLETSSAPRWISSRGDDQTATAATYRKGSAPCRVTGRCILRTLRTPAV